MLKYGNIWEADGLRIYFNKLIRIMKAALICLAITGSLLLGAFRPELQGVRQSFDLKTSAIVSLGFSSALCMVINDSKKR
jgi:hypothetical protein